MMTVPRKLRVDGASVLVQDSIRHIEHKIIGAIFLEFEIRFNADRPTGHDIQANFFDSFTNYLNSLESPRYIGSNS